MLPSFLISLREGLEAALILGIVFGALRKLGRPGLTRFVWSGALVAATFSLATALILHRFGLALEGPAEPVFEGLTMLVAAGVLTWMIFWMQRQSRQIKGALEADVRRATQGAGGRALFFLAFLAVLREGVELALFLTAAVFNSDAQQTMLGALVGLAAAAALGWALFAGTLRLNLRTFFQVTGALLILFAAGLVAHGVHELNEVGWIPAVVAPVWDLNVWVHEDSAVGQVLKALFGYNGNPSLTELLAYLAYFALITIGLRRLASPLSPAPRKAA